MPADTALMEKLVAVCKRRGFIFPSSEIYGGIGGFWDYGPLGVELKRNVKEQWWKSMVTSPPDGPDGKQVEMVGLDCSIIMNPKVWEASGHATGFADPMQTCRQCKKLYRTDHVEGLLNEAEWYRSLAGWFVEGLDDEKLSRWIRKVGSKTAPGLAIVRDQSNVHPRVGKTLRSLGAGVASFPEFVGLIATPMDRPISVETRACPNCGGDLTEPRSFNLMFKTHYGAMEDSASLAYLRPETAQGIFVNFKNVLDTSRVKLPFGIGQVGKAFRNEINPRNFTFRSREFEQMEIEFFCHEEHAMEWYRFWRDTRYRWYTDLGLRSDKLRLRDQGADELAHYSQACADIEYLFPFSDDFQELEGVAHRGCFDLTQHQKHSGKDMSYFDDELWQKDAANYKADKAAAEKAKSGPPYRFLPTVIEPSAGADRATLAFLCEAYREEEVPSEKGAPEVRTVLRFHPKLAPIKAAILPLVNKEGMPDRAYRLYRHIQKRYNVFFDDKGAIGRRYRRQDEAGTPFCITIDGETMQSGTVTIRDRDSLQQVRVGLDSVVPWLEERLG